MLSHSGFACILLVTVLSVAFPLASGQFLDSHLTPLKQDIFVWSDWDVMLLLPWTS
jgi:hypothetical protein